MYSTDDGATWLGTGDSVMWHTVDATERTTLALTGGPFPLGIALRLTTNNIGALVDGQCQLNVRVENRNPIPPEAPPF